MRYVLTFAVALVVSLSVLDRDSITETLAANHQAHLSPIERAVEGL